MRRSGFMFVLLASVLAGCSDSYPTFTTRSYALRNSSESTLIAALLREAWDHGYADPQLKSQITEDNHALVTAPPSVHRKVEAALAHARRGDQLASPK
jgi:hypothetical protein